MNEHKQLYSEPLTRPLWARRLTRVLVTVCLVLMALAVMSQPKVTDLVHVAGLRFEGVVDRMSHYLSNESLSSNVTLPGNGPADAQPTAQSGGVFSAQ